MRYRNQATSDIHNGISSQRARAALPGDLHERAARLMDRIGAATAPSDLRTPRGNRLHQLTGNRAGQWSISINDQYRICFAWQAGQAVDVEVTDYH